MFSTLILALLAYFGRERPDEADGGVPWAPHSFLKGPDEGDDA